MKRAGRSEETQRIELNMTPMIDVVFQLLIFFMLSLKLLAPEGDFHIRMPKAAPAEGQPDPTQLPPIKVRLTADRNGNLRGIQMAEKPLRSLEQLRNEVLALVCDERGPKPEAAKTEIDFDCDYHLRYSYVVEAMTAVSGYVDRNDRIVKVIEKIKFTRRQKE